MHHPHFLPARYFEFLNHVDAAAIIIKLLRNRGEHTGKAIADLHAEQYDKCVAWHIACRPDGWVLFAVAQSIGDAIATHLNEAATA